MTIFFVCLRVVVRRIVEVGIVVKMPLKTRARSYVWTRMHLYIFQAKIQNRYQVPRKKYVVRNSILCVCCSVKQFGRSQILCVKGSLLEISGFYENSSGVHISQTHAYTKTIVCDFINRTFLAREEMSQKRECNIALWSRSSTHFFECKII